MSKGSRYHNDRQKAWTFLFFSFLSSTAPTSQRYLQQLAQALMVCSTLFILFKRWLRRDDAKHAACQCKMYALEVLTVVGFILNAYQVAYVVKHIPGTIQFAAYFHLEEPLH